MNLASFSRCAAVLVPFVVAQHAAPQWSVASDARAQSTQQKSSQPQSRTQKLANPLNDLLDEAQKDIDNNQFEAAVIPLQKFIGEEPDIAWAHFQLAYAYTALKRPDQARSEYERATTLESGSFAESQISTTITNPIASRVIPVMSNRP